MAKKAEFSLGNMGPCKDLLCVCFQVPRIARHLEGDVHLIPVCLQRMMRVTMEPRAAWHVSIQHISRSLEAERFGLEIVLSL